MTTGLEAIRDTIIEQAEARAREILRDAEEERDRTLREAREEAERRTREMVEESKDRARTRYQEKLGAIRSELKRELLTKREELIEEAWRRAREDISAYVGDDSYREELKSTVIDAALEIGGESFKVHANPRDLDFLKGSKEEIEGALEVQGRDIGMIPGEEIDCIGGVKVSDPEGRIILDRSYDSRMRRLRSSLRPRLAGILTEGSE